MAGQAAEEDAGHEGQPHPGHLIQVGLREGPVEVEAVAEAGQSLDLSPQRHVCEAAVV